MLEITTSRLQLIASNVELAQADYQDIKQFAKLLNANVPDNWPPEFNDDNSKKYTFEKLKEHPENTGWHCWYFILNGPNKRTLIGIGGFKGRANADGQAEVGYGILPQYQRKGFATEAVRGLINWAFDQHVNTVTAETLPELTASIALAKKLGFEFMGPTGEEDVIQFALKNPGLLFRPTSK